MSEMGGGSNTYDPGREAINVLRVASNVADTETVTIGSDIYEFDNNASFTVGHIQVDVTGDLTPANATLKLVAAINASATNGVKATKISNNEVLLYSNSVGAITLACSETMAGVNNAWDMANMGGGSSSRFTRVQIQQRIPTAQEVTLGNMHFRFDFTPVKAIVFIAPTATPGAYKVWDGAITISGGRVTLDNAGATDWAASDTVTLIVTD